MNHSQTNEQRINLINSFNNQLIYACDNLTDDTKINQIKLKQLNCF